jgi:hypothetical protein
VSVVLYVHWLEPVGDELLITNTIYGTYPVMEDITREAVDEEVIVQD